MHYSCNSLRALLVVLTAILAGAPSLAAEPTEFRPEQIEFFEKEVRPLLAARCYDCHSAQSKEIAGGLRVDARASLLAGGDTGPAIEPGNAKESLLVDAINYGDIYQMPPKSKLPAAEIATLTKWVDMGAPWPAGEEVAATSGSQFDLAQRRADHWSWRAVSAPEVPQVSNTSWPRDDLDRFVLARLEAEQWQPAGRADRRTLIRRLYFDLTGLPPKPAEVEAFLADDSPQAYPQLVDRLLDSPRFGERWARHWLDLVRYAESRGHEFDYDAPNAYQYRDYVIRALNADVPYDQFVKEHVAGDLLDDVRTHPTENYNESILGTGFWFLGEWVHSPVDIRQDEADRHDNMIDVFSKTFLGLTVACARCHDHKFDAIAQSDYYALAGFLQSSTYRQVRFETMLQNGKLQQELAQLRADQRPKIAAAVAAAMKPTVAQTSEYLRAAGDLIGKLSAPDRLPSNNKARRALLSRFSTRIEALAAARSLDADTLLAWTNHLLDASQQADSPLAVWFELTRGLEGSEAAAKLSSIATREGLSLAEAVSEFDVIVDYSQAKPQQWIVDGPTFGSRPVAQGELLLGSNASQPIVSLAEQGMARREPFWNGLKLAPGTQNDPGRTGGWVRAGETIRTPTFTIDRTNLYYLVRGSARVYAEVDSHRVNQGPLHGSLIKKIDTKGALQWIGHDLRRYSGHGAHVEFSAVDDHPLEIIAVVQGDQAPAFPEAANASHLAQQLQELDSTEQVALAAATQNILLAVVEKLAANSLQEPADIALASWLLSHGDMFGLEQSPAKEELAAATKLYFDQLAKLSQKRLLESHTGLAMWDGNGVDEHLFIRGNHKTLGDVVPRRTLLGLQGDQSLDYGPGSGRLQLAEQLTSAENPYVSRVMVNRVWHHLFGHGLVRSVDNFGVLGQEPRHAELLDHLSIRFMQEGWSVKHLIRTIMLSSTYQMASSGSSAEAEAADPTNQLLHRQNIRRLEGESIRDSILAVSGRLNETMFGPSVPIHLTSFLQGRGRPGSGPIDGHGRRSIYLSVRRNFLSPMMLAFDTPIPFTTVGRRNVSNVPAQALILLNDPFVVEEAKRWAQTVLGDPAELEPRVQTLYQQAFAREATDRELAAARAFISGQGAQFNLSPKQAASDLRVWTDLCHVLFNAKEFVFIR